MRYVWAFSGGLLAWSFAANLGLGEFLYVPRNLVATAALLFLAERARLDRDALGLRASGLAPGLRWGGASAAVIAVVVASGLLLADVLGPVAALLADDRAAGLGAAALAYNVLVRIPVGTALFEEIAFRGVLSAACREVLRPAVATVWSSAVFGLWHIPPTAVALRINDVDPWSTTGLSTIAGAVAVTSVAGVLFEVLRRRSGSLAAPVIAHWATNACGLLAAAATR